MPVTSQTASSGYAELFGSVGPSLPGDKALRERCFARFSELGLPTQRAEAWKYTSLAPLAALSPRVSAAAATDRAQIKPYFSPDAAVRFVFVDGIFQEDLSETSAIPAGVTASTLEAALAHEPGLLDDHEGDRSLTALNGAFAREGIALRVEAGAKIEESFQALFITTGDAAVLTSPRNRVYVAAGASLKLIETHIALGNGGVTNLVNLIDVEDEGEFIHDRVILGGPASIMIAKTYQTLGERSVTKQTAAALGGRLVRQENLAKLTGPFADLTLNGVFVPCHNEHIDNVIRIEHLAPNCESNQYYKGVLMEGGHGVFAGKILVAQEAQKTNAYQQNHNLMLSRDAEIDTKPELEIYADDVKCSHGATVGELDEEGLFYLRSRGIDHITARTILSFAFAGEVLERFESEDCRHLVRRALLDRLPGGEQLKELV